jgi:predicted phage-related endonuclease
LTSSRLAARKHILGGSAARVIMTGDEERIHRLYQEMRGELDPEDLSDVLQVQLGLWTEEFNRLWYIKHTGRNVTDAGQVVTHPDHHFLGGTLDGRTTTEAGLPAIFEAKHVNPFKFDQDECIATYQPQLQHYMMVTQLSHAALSVLVGTTRWCCAEISADPFYQAELLTRLRSFWTSVETGLPLHVPPPVAPPVPPDKLQTVDMTLNNLWAVRAASWRDTLPHKKTNEEAERELKDMVKPDVGRAFGHGVQVKRDAAGRLRLTPHKEGD